MSGLPPPLPLPLPPGSGDDEEITFCNCAKLLRKKSNLSYDLCMTCHFSMDTYEYAMPLNSVVHVFFTFLNFGQLKNFSCLYIIENDKTPELSTYYVCLLLYCRRKLQP